MSPKPILVVKYPTECMSREHHEYLVKQVKLAVNDEYHVLIIRSTNIEDVEIQVFYEKDFTEIKYEELKKIINESLK